MKKFVFVNPKVWILFFAILFVVIFVPIFYISIIFDIRTGIVLFVSSYFFIFLIKIILGFYKIDREMSKEIIFIGKKKYFLEEGKIYFFFFTRFKEIFLIPKENQIFGKKEIKVTKINKDDGISVLFNVSFEIENVEKFYKFYKFKNFFTFNEFQNYLSGHFSSYFDYFFQKYDTDIFILRNFSVFKKNEKFEDFNDPEIISSILELEDVTGVNINNINFEVDEKK